jgi:hypothetical protein
MLQNGGINRSLNFGSEELVQVFGINYAYTERREDDVVCTFFYALVSPGGLTIR